MFDKRAAVRAGGYATDTVGEDMELVSGCIVTSTTASTLSNRLRAGRDLLDGGA